MQDMENAETATGEASGQQRATHPNGRRVGALRSDAEISSIMRRVQSADTTP